MSPCGAAGIATGLDLLPQVAHSPTRQTPALATTLRRSPGPVALVVLAAQQPSYAAQGWVPSSEYSLLNAASCWATDASPAVPE
jgi:hypothetical protein